MSYWWMGLGDSKKNNSWIEGMKTISSVDYLWSEDMDFAKNKI